MSGYFDANATTPLCPQARAAWLEAADEFWQNPSSPSRASARVHACLEQARAKLAAMFDAPPESVVFNSGATEGNRDVFTYWKLLEPTKKIAVSAIEHPSVLENAQVSFPQQTAIIPVDGQGQISLEALDKRLSLGDISLLSLMAANNETGVIQPWPEALEICRRHRVAMHIDATQWIGKMPLADASNRLAAVDFVTGSGHKFCGPKGIGFVIVSPNFSGFYGQRGGAQENDHRAGTENYPAIAGMLAALLACQADWESELHSGRNALELKLMNAISGLNVWGSRASNRLPNTSSLCMPKGKNTQWVRRLDRKGFIVSTGSACATGKDAPSHVLAAMGASAEEARRTVRVSGLTEATTSDWDSLTQAILEIWESGDFEQRNSQVIDIP